MGSGACGKGTGRQPVSRQRLWSCAIVDDMSVPIGVKALLKIIGKNQAAGKLMASMVEDRMRSIAECPGRCRCTSAAELVDRTISDIGSVISRAANDVEYDESFEQYLLHSLGKHAEVDVDAWSCHASIHHGEVIAEFRFIGCRAEQCNNDLEKQRAATLEMVLKTVLGAEKSTVSWQIDVTPREWGRSGGKDVVVYVGHAVWTYEEGSAVEFAMGRMEMAIIADRVLSDATAQPCQPS